MPRLPERDDTYITTVRGMCRTCRKIVPARVALRSDGVWQTALCPDHTNASVKIAGDAAAWFDARKNMPRDHAPLSGAHPPKASCPHDCGPCTWHASPCQLPVVSITNQCELRCPICFTWNRCNPIWHMPLEEMRQIAQSLVVATGGVDLIDLTGGEPTLHPNLLALIDACRIPGIGRVVLNSNGLRLSQDSSLCQELARRDVCVVLSYHAHDRESSLKIHGADLRSVKQAALANLRTAGCRYVLLTALCRDCNEGVLAECLDLLAQDPWMRGWCIQTMTYTGQGGGSFPERKHLPVDEATQILCQHSGGRLKSADFTPRPSAHPLCYRVGFFLKEASSIFPLSRLAPPQRIAGLLSDSYLPRLGQDPTFLRDVANEAAATGADPLALQALRALISACHPSTGISEAERQRRAEERLRSIYLHAHMDEDTFDTSRAMCCPDVVPTEPGRLVPACTYNLFHRMRDHRFFEGS